jgi:proton-translocating NADH-quinone oxidoreductase chain M
LKKNLRIELINFFYNFNSLNVLGFFNSLGTLLIYKFLIITLILYTCVCYFTINNLIFFDFIFVEMDNNYFFINFLKYFNFDIFFFFNKIEENYKYFLTCLINIIFYFSEILNFFFYYFFVNDIITNKFIFLSNILLFFIPIIHLILLLFTKIRKKISLIFAIFKLNLICIYFFILNIFEINVNILFILNWSFFFNIDFIFGIDYISLSFIFLSDLLNIICLLLIWSNIQYRKNAYQILLVSCNFLLFLIFISTDLFIFYFFFELILIPMFFLISQWGSRLRKIHASMQFFLYTIIGSLIFLFGLLYLNINYQTTDILVLKFLIICSTDQIILFLTFFLAFAIKVPIYPFHLWLPEAHVEAPTAGSVLLAGILLKLGTYGFLKFFFLLIPLSSLYFLPLVNMLCIIGIIYSSFIILRQIDIKKIIAYSSVIHMNYTILGLFNFNFLSFYGSYFLMLSHGIISSALFICIGFLYERYHTRIIFYYGNLVTVMPLMSIFFLLFTLGNVGFPSTSSFIGEFFIFVGLFESNLFIASLTLIGLFISVIYSFLLYNKIFFFNALDNNNYFMKYTDLNKREFIILYILLIFMFFYGIYTKTFFNIHYYSLNDLYFNSKYKLLINHL